jgi:hypothetical protein
MWSSWVNRKGTTQLTYIAKLKDGPNGVKKTFSIILQRVFEMVWWRRRKWNHMKKDFWSWSVFSSQNIDFPFYLKRLLELFFFPLFFALSIDDSGGFDHIWGENYFFKNFFSNGFNILAVDAYSRMELCRPTWLNHDYGDGGVVDILAVDTYSRVEVCMPIFLGEARKKISG